MRISIIDPPSPIAESYYLQSLQAMTQKLIRTGVAKAVYQIGGVSSPGISDLDMVVVFNHEAVVTRNFLMELNEDERYLFIHNLYGISINHFADAEKFAFYHNYKLLYGEEVRSYACFSIADIQVLKVQIALEYMLKMYITIFLQQTYGVLRMRDLLLHVKAIQYDIEFLGVNSGNVTQAINQVLEWRSSWFEKTPTRAEVLEWWNGFYKDFNDLIDEKLAALPFYLPTKKNYRISGNILLVPAANRISVSHKGFIIPQFFSFVGKKYFRLQNRMNRFQFYVPVQSSGIPEIISAKFHFEQTIVEYNRKYLPHFLPITSSLHTQ